MAWSRKRREERAHRFQYSAWDGSQLGFDLDADQLLDELSDDLLYHGHLDAALRRLLKEGLTLPDGERIQGLQEMLERLRERKQETLDKFDLGGNIAELAEKLREILDTERDALEDLIAEAAESGDQRRQEITNEVATEKGLQLDLLPPDLAGQVRSLEKYDFLSSEAREAYEELVEKLREELMQKYVEQLTGAMSDPDPEQMARLKDMMADLNAMLEQRSRGEEPDFDSFMAKHGDFFPEEPQTLDELLEILAARMAAMQAMLNSMTPEQRAQLQELSDQLLGDMDLRWQVEQLSENLQGMFPDMGWDQRYNFDGQDPLDFASASQVMNELGDLDQLEQMLKGARDPGALAEVDIDRARQLLGDEAGASLDQLQQLAKKLEDAGYLERKEGRMELTSRGIRQLGQQALAQLFRKLDKAALGKHDIEQVGIGHEREHTTKPYEFGDPFNLDIQRTIRNAITRTGGGTPVRLTPDDFEVERTEQMVRTSTVLMLDLSLSMPMRGWFLPAKRVAMALHSLISMQYPRDYLAIVGFASRAKELTPDQLPEVSWDYEYGTNMAHAFQLSRALLAKQSGTKQIIMITDGEPTAHLLRNGEVYFNYPPVRETVDATLREVVRCTRDNIRINTFALDPDPGLGRFIEVMTQMNKGRAFFTNGDTLGEFVLVDFIEQRRKLLRRAS